MQEMKDADWHLKKAREKMPGWLRWLLGDTIHHLEQAEAALNALRERLESPPC